MQVFRVMLLKMTANLSTRLAVIWGLAYWVLTWPLQGNHF